VRPARHLSAVLVLIVGAVLAGCGSEVGRTPVREPPPARSGPRPTDAAAAVPTHVPNAPSARALVSLDQCTVNGTTWRAAGTARSDGTRTTYSIMVFFANEHATVRGSAHTRVTVGRSEPRPWSATARLRTGSGIRCVLRGVAPTG
jgi:hypothetical protein